MDIKTLEKAAKQGDLEAVSKILAREIFEVRCKAEDAGLKVDVFALTLGGIAVCACILLAYYL